MAIYRAQSRRPLALIGIAGIGLGLIVGVVIGRSIAPELPAQLASARAEVRPILTALDVARIEYPKLLSGPESGAPGAVQRARDVLILNRPTFELLNPDATGRLETALGRVTRLVEARAPEADVEDAITEAEAVAHELAGTVAAGGGGIGGGGVGAGSGGNGPPVATVIPGSQPPNVVRTPNPNPSYPTGGPIPSHGLASPFIASGQAPVKPRPTPRPDGGEIVTYLLSPADFADAMIRPGSTLTVYEDGSIRLDSVRDQTGDNNLEWILADPPPQEDVLDVYARGCGWGDGDFYEIYGPWDSVEFEYEVTPPAEDGCWHFTEAVGKAFDFEIWLYGDSSMTITRLELVVTMKA